MRLSRLDSDDSGQEPVEEAEDRDHCNHLVEGRSAEKASEGEDKYNGVHTNYMPVH